MRPRILRRKTSQPTSALSKPKPPQPKVKSGQIIKITAGTHTGKKAEILKVTKVGAIVSVAEPFAQSGTSYKYVSQFQDGTVKGAKIVRHPTKHKIVVIKHGGFSINTASKPQLPHVRIPHRKRRIILRKLKELIHLKQGKPGTRKTAKSTEKRKQRISQLQKELRMG